MEWQQLLLTFLGSVFGFGFVLVAQSIFDKRNERARIETVRENLNQELRRIRASFVQLLKPDKRHLLEKRTISPNTPIWDSIVSTGDLLILLKKNSEFFVDVLGIYFKVHEIEKMEAESKHGDFMVEQMQEVADGIEILLNQQRD